MTIKNLKTLLTILLLITIVRPAYSEQIQLLDEIEHRAYVYGLSEAQARFDNPVVSVSPLDSRLRLEQCETDLMAFTNSNTIGAGHQTVGIKCTSPVAWTVYVSLKVQVLKPVVVAARGLSAKHIITSDDLRIERQDVTKLRRGYLEDTKPLIGQQLKHSIAMGTILNPSIMAEQKVVKRGEQIMLVASVGQMEVRMAGTALSDAEQGQRIRVKNVSSKRIVEGIVDGPGVVRVTM